jgi:viroplasmin and RNaseH domain-containing protein
LSKQPLPSSKWTSHLKDETEKEEFQKRLTQSRDLFRRLGSMASGLKRSNHRTKISKTSYENPNWAYLQADSVGYERALNEILEYLNFSKD